MTPEQAHIWNAAIDQAAKTYPKGIGSIKALRKQFVVTVDHISPYQTKQEVRVDEENG